MKVVVCGKFGVGVVAFDWWLWKKSWFVGFRKLFCGGYESVKRHSGLQWTVMNVLLFWESGLFEWIGG